jgi:hypothetical protein
VLCGVTVRLSLQVKFLRRDYIGMYPHQLYRSRREAALDEHFRHCQRLDHGIVQAAQGETTALRVGIVEAIASKNSNVRCSERRGQLAAVGPLDESGELL